MVAGAQIVLLHGDDETLLANAVARAVAEAVGDRMRTDTVHELRGEDVEVAEIIDAGATPPLFADRRVVVARELERFGVDELAPLCEALADPLLTTWWVLEWRPGQTRRRPKRLDDAVRAGGGQVLSASAPGRAPARRSWVDERIAAAGIDLEPAALRLIVDHLGEDVSRLEAILDTLAAVHGPEVRVGADDVRPYLGERGGLKPWDLTDPIDDGDVAAALRALGRLLEGEMHPLQVVALLQRHVEQALRLDGSGATDERTAAEALGTKGSTFPAKKALARLRRLGPATLRDQVGLLAGADLDLKGASGLDPRTVIEVAVARMADPRRRRR